MRENKIVIEIECDSGDDSASIQVQEIAPDGSVVNRVSRDGIRYETDTITLPDDWEAPSCPE